MLRALLVRGMVVGVVAGLLGWGVARLVGEPQLERAIDFESYLEDRAEGEHAGHDESGDEIVSRSVQSSVGLGAGALLYGVALGGIFAIVFALAFGRLGTVTGRGTAAALGVIGFVVVTLVPALKYPSNPPAVGLGDTVDRRTGLHLLILLLSVLAAVVAVVVRRHLVSRWGEWEATLLVAAGYVVAMVLCFVFLPGVNEVPQEALPGVIAGVGDTGLTFPPTVLWRFRLASLAVQSVMWASIAVGFGLLAGRLLDAPPTTRGDPAPAPR